MGLKSSQATTSSGSKPPFMAPAELASWALRSRPWSETQASRRAATGTGGLGATKELERRREEEGVNGVRETRGGAELEPKKRSGSCCSMAYERERGGSG